MFDPDRTIRDSGVEIQAPERPSLGCLRVVVLESQDPLAWRRLCRPRSERREDVGNRGQLAIDLAEMPEPGVAGMRVRINETGDDGLASEVIIPNLEIKKISK